ncbi:MAG: VCBS repeat-containing protein [Planctomycetota bacterium]|nr:VCBS repeat-containing protein [Planctomycetota bacterium]
MRIFPGSLVLASFFVCGSLHAQEGGDAVTLLRFDSGAPSDRIGEAVALAGDVDADGTPDILIGAEFASSFGFNRNGSVFVHSGATGGLLYQFHGDADFEKFGTSIASVGDINNDGHDDILVGSPEASPTGLTQAGQIDIFSGADGLSLLHIDGTVDYGFFGRAVAGCSDIDGDTIPDFIVGESGFNNFSGRVMVYSGLTGLVIHTINGSSGSAMGWSVSCAGDLNADTVPDVLIGSPDADSLTFTDNGRAEIYSGATAALLLQLDGADDDIHFGYAVSGGLDVNLDDQPDVIVGAPFANPGGNLAAGSAFVYSGINGALLYQVDGQAAIDNLGSSCALAGDVDGDAFGDFVVGARLSDVGGMSDAGSVLVFSGQDGSLLFRTDGTAALDNVGRAVASGRDIDGDGSNEVIYGAPFADPLGNPLAGLAELQSLVPILDATIDTISSSAGGTIDFTMNFPPSEAGFRYILLASFSGRGPTQAYGVSVPLTIDPLFDLMRVGAPPVFSNASGILDASGNASSQLNMPPGTVPGLISSTAYFAAVSFSGATSPRLVSNAIGVLLEP